MTLVTEQYKQHLTLNKETIESLGFKELDYDYKDPKFKFLHYFSINPNFKEFTMFQFLHGYESLRLFYAENQEDVAVNIIIVDLHAENYFGLAAMQVFNKNQLIRILCQIGIS